MCGVVNETVHWPRRNIAKIMVIHAGIFIVNYVKNMKVNKQEIVTSMSQKKLSRTKTIRFSRIYNRA